MAPNTKGGNAGAAARAKEKARAAAVSRSFAEGLDGEDVPDTGASDFWGPETPGAWMAGRLAGIAPGSFAKDVATFEDILRADNPTGTPTAAGELKLTLNASLAKRITSDGVGAVFLLTFREWHKVGSNQARLFDVRVLSPAASERVTAEYARLMDAAGGEGGDGDGDGDDLPF